MTSAKERSIWYQEPAEAWIEALPIGNGSLGAMIYGNPIDEQIQLNEETVWAGAKTDRINPDAQSALKEARDHLSAGEYEEAETIIEADLVGDPMRIRPYQSLGEIDIQHPEKVVRNYRRELDLTTGTARVEYETDDGRVIREQFASLEDDVIVFRVRSDGPKPVSIDVSLDREQDARAGTRGDSELVLRGNVINLPDEEAGEGGWGVSFESALRVIEASEVSVKDGYLHVEGENSVTLLVAAATSYDGADPTTDCVNVLNEASEYSYAELHSRHIDEYGELFGRVSVDLGEPDSRPTDERLAAVQDEEHDPDLAALYFQFSRYLLLTSSYDCQLPANLQGIWNGEMYPEWESDFHLNINLQMNYWPAQVCNLPECVEPLVSFVDDLRASGRRTAREHYGCDGFVAHHATDAWSTTTPVWSGGVWPMGVTWLCRLLWDHYAFSEDEQFLREYGYPILKEHAEFFLDFLVEDDDGRLVTAPSNSPENRFVTSSGYEALYCTGPTLDIQLLRDLFNNLIEASAVIERDDPIVDDVSDAVEDLPSHRIGDRGQLQEWLEDHDEADPGHRHISHLYGAYPSDQITLRETPDLARATRTTLERRLEHGSGNTGWSRAWFISQYARLEEGDIAHKHLYESLNTYTAANLFGIHPDFETGEPIFQIDGNFGGGAGIAEMLLQSHQRELKILPALPTEWSDGRVEGLRARGDFEVEIAWTDGSLHDLVVHSDGGNRCRVRTYNGIEVDSVKTDSGIAIEYDHLDENIVAFDTEPGTTYRLKYS